MLSQDCYVTLIGCLTSAVVNFLPMQLGFEMFSSWEVCDVDCQITEVDFLGLLWFPHTQRTTNPLLYLLMKVINMFKLVLTRCKINKVDTCVYTL